MAGVLQRLPEQAEHHHPYGDVRLVVQLLPLRLHRSRDPLEHDHVHAELPRLSGEVQLMAGTRRTGSGRGTPVPRAQPGGHRGRRPRGDRRAAAARVQHRQHPAARRPVALRRVLARQAGSRPATTYGSPASRSARSPSSTWTATTCGSTSRSAATPSWARRPSATVRIKTILGQKYLDARARRQGRARPARSRCRARRPGVRRGGGVQRPRDDHRRDRHRAAGRRRWTRWPTRSATRRTRCAPPSTAWAGCPAPSPPATTSCASCSTTPTASPACWPTATRSSSR